MGNVTRPLAAAPRHACPHLWERALSEEGRVQDNTARRRGTGQLEEEKGKKRKEETNETARNIAGEDSAGTNGTMMVAMLDEKQGGYYPCTGLDEGSCASAHHQYASAHV